MTNQFNDFKFRSNIEEDFPTNHLWNINNNQDQNKNNFDQSVFQLIWTNIYIFNILNIKKC